MSHPHLDRAPINEAVLEIRTELPTSSDSKRLDAFAAKVRPEYAKRREHIQFSVGFQGGTPTQAQQSLHGLLIDHEELPQIVHARLDGFAFSRLRPYERWDGLREEARRLWEVYRDVFHPEKVTRLGLRYINSIELSIASDARTLLTILPSIPPALAPVGVSSFTLQLLSEHPDFEAAARVLVHLPNVPPDADTVAMILDIDVFKTRTYEPNDPGVWEHLDQLRELKNVLFFSSITPEARTRYEHAAPSL